MRPFARGEKSLIAGTEAVHRSCALAGGATLRGKLEVANAELERRLAETERAREGAVSEWMRHLRMLADVQRDKEATERNYLRVVRERDDALARARGLELQIEAARHAQQSAERPAESPTTEEGVARFRLLELD